VTRLLLEVMPYPPPRLDAPPLCRHSWMRRGTLAITSLD
jgi:hypothetical protein